MHDLDVEKCKNFFKKIRTTESCCGVRKWTTIPFSHILECTICLRLVLCARLEDFIDSHAFNVFMNESRHHEDVRPGPWNVAAFDASEMPFGPDQNKKLIQSANYPDFKFYGVAIRELFIMLYMNMVQEQKYIFMCMVMANRDYLSQFYRQEKCYYMIQYIKTYLDIHQVTSVLPHRGGLTFPQHAIILLSELNQPISPPLIYASLDINGVDIPSPTSVKPTARSNIEFYKAWMDAVEE